MNNKDLTEDFSASNVYELELPQNYPHQINLPHSVIHNLQKMSKI